MNDAAQPTAIETSYTPEPWYREGRTVRADLPAGGPFLAPFTSDVCRVVDAADGDRIVACVNACKGINPDAVPKMLAALLMAEERLENLAGSPSEKGIGHYTKTLAVVRAAIASATKQP